LRNVPWSSGNHVFYEPFRRVPLTSACLATSSARSAAISSSAGRFATTTPRARLEARLPPPSPRFPRRKRHGDTGDAIASARHGPTPKQRFYVVGPSHFGLRSTCSSLALQRLSEVEICVSLDDVLQKCERRKKKKVGSLKAHRASGRPWCLERSTTPRINPAIRPRFPRPPSKSAPHAAISQFRPDQRRRSGPTTPI